MRMTQYREILKLASLGINKQDIALACACSRNTVAHVLKRAAERSLSWEEVRDWSNKELSGELFPPSIVQASYKMPDYELCPS